MKQFFKYVFASTLGFILAQILIGIISFFIIVGVISSVSSTVSTAGKPGKITKVDKNSVLHIQLDRKIEDRSSNNPLENFDFGSFEANPEMGLNDILKNIKKAKEDERIKGILLEFATVRAGTATIEEIRNALLDFKSSGKFIMSYSEAYTQKSYYLASVANEVYLNPAGLIGIRGLSAQLMFFKNTLEKLDIDMQIIRHGKYKSAVEPFMRENMSEANRKQTDRFLNSFWDHMVSGIAETRGLTEEEINRIADNLLIRDADDAIEYNFIDETIYKDELLAKLREKTEKEEDEEIAFVKLSKYTNAKVKALKEELKDKAKKDKIAVIYASGEIRSGKSEKGVMGSETIAKAIRKARKDEKIKAVVLRVNSPGGSALASDVMWREVVLTKKEKPVIVSMGDVAASGGYYISCAADRIIADPNTVTGSIGVFGVIPNAKGFFNNKLGITFDTVNTNAHSDIMTVFRPLTAEEKDIIQQGVEKIYDDFITKVAEGRNMTKAEVDSIGQGRVWSGVDAREIGLIDELGGLDKAIAVAAEKAELEDYEIKDYPERKDPFEELIKEMVGGMETSVIEEELGENYVYYKHLQSILESKGMMARMPYEMEIY